MFTIVDMDKGYWQVVLHPDSRKYTYMAFDIGRYQFKRLPMGSKVASDIFQKKLDSVYIGFPGVTGIADDMVIVCFFHLEQVKWIVARKQITNVDVSSFRDFWFLRWQWPIIRILRCILHSS